jgi:hypothetical protein
MPRKGHSGRKKGATSCIRVALKDLKVLLSGEATVMVNKRWAEQVGVTVKYEPISMDGERVYSTLEEISADASTVDIKVQKFAQEPELVVELESVDLNKDTPEVIDW